MNKKKANEIISKLQEYYIEAKCGLNFTTPFELLVATILSAQCTDVRVNVVTQKLFSLYNTPVEFAFMSNSELEEIIKPCGMYIQKSKNIINTSRQIVEKYSGEVPDNFDELVKLPGVGRKTANVVLCNAFNVPAFAVDTHVFRVSRRIGLAKGETVEIVEEELSKSINKTEWCNAHHLIINHGRQICKARKPLCDICPIRDLCQFDAKNVKDKIGN